MNAKLIEKTIYRQFFSIATSAGFSGTNNGFPFSRQVECGLQEIFVPISDHNPHFTFNFLVGIRYHAVDKIVNALTGIAPEYWNQNYSAVIGFEYFLGSFLKYEVSTLEEIDEAMKHVISIFNDHVFPLLERSRTLEQGECLINRSQEKKFRLTDDRLAATGVVSAALCRRADFNNVVDLHRERLSGYIEPIRREFETVVAHAATLR